MTEPKSPCLARDRDGKPCILLAPHDGADHQKTVLNPSTTAEFK